MEPHKDNSVLILHGWPSKQLAGITPLMCLLALPVLCSLAWGLRGTAASLLHVQIPYWVILWVFLLASGAVFRAGRWPFIPKTSRPRWHLQISTKGFAARPGAGTNADDWQRWLANACVSFRRVKADTCRVRIGTQDSYHYFMPEAIDLVVVCEDQAIEQVRTFIEACREGRKVAVPAVESDELAARSVASQLRADTSAVESAELQMEQCPQCEYDLIGLPEAGRCPECGFDYDPQSLIVLYGRRACSPGYLPASTWAWILLRSILWMFVYPCGYMAGRWLGITSTWAQVLIIGGALSAVSVPFARRRHDPHNPRSGWPIQEARNEEAQLRLSPAGFGMRLGYGACLMRPWSARMHVRIERVKGTTYRLLISNSPSHLTFRTYIWGRFDLDSDERTVKRILERVEQWRQSAGSLHAARRLVPEGKP